MVNFPLLKYRKCGMPYLEFSTSAIIEKVRLLIQNNDSRSEAYKRKSGSNPFIQCYDPEGEYMLVEFWGNPKLVRDYVSWLKEQLHVGNKENHQG